MPFIPDPIEETSGFVPEIKEDRARRLSFLKREAEAAGKETKKSLVGRFGGELFQTFAKGPARFAASALEVPETVLRGRATQRTYKIPGIDPFKSFQSEAENISGRIIEGEAPLYTALKPFVEAPLAATEAVGIGRGVKATTKGISSIFGKGAEQAKVAAGRILQPRKDQGFVQGIGAKVLGDIDTRGVKTYEDLSQTIESTIKLGLQRVDEGFSRVKEPILLKNLNRTTSVKTIEGKTRKATLNFVKSALEDLKELYDKTRNPVESLRIGEMIKGADKRGITPSEINIIAREYGTTFKTKAFNKVGDPITSVNAVTYENTRKGIKETARSFLPGKELRQADERISEMIKVKSLSDQMRQRVAALENRIKNRNLVEKLFRGVAELGDILTLGGPKAFITKLFFPSNVGLKTMNSLDIQREIAKNLKIIKRISEMSDEGLISSLRDLAKNVGVISGAAGVRETSRSIFPL